MAFTKFTNSESHEVLDKERAARLASALHTEQEEDDEAKRQRIAKILDESK